MYHIVIDIITFLGPELYDPPNQKNDGFGHQYCKWACPTTTHGQGLQYGPSRRPYCSWTRYKDLIVYFCNLIYFGGVFEAFW